MTLMFFMKPSLWAPPSGTPLPSFDGEARRKKKRKELRKLLIQARKHRLKQEEELILLLLELNDN